MCGDRSHKKSLVIAVAPESLAIDLSSTLTCQSERCGGDDPDRPSDAAPADGTVDTLGSAVGATPAFLTLTCTVPSQMPTQSLSAPPRLAPPAEPSPVAV
jgi:hypothetical protein